MLVAEHIDLYQHRLYLYLDPRRYQLSGGWRCIGSCLPNHVGRRDLTQTLRFKSGDSRLYCRLCTSGELGQYVMKGITKFLQRTPHMVSSKVGMSAKSTDVEFDHLRHKFEAMEKLIKQLAKESNTYLGAVKSVYFRFS